MADIQSDIDKFDYNGPVIERSVYRTRLFKVATGDEPFNRHQQKIIRTVVKAHRETGAPILTYTNKVVEKAESATGGQFSVGDEAYELGYPNMFNALDQRKQPNETFYNGYVVNALIDAGYKSAKTKQWEIVELPVWRGQTGLTKPSVFKEYDADHWFIKDEILPNGDKKLILRKKGTGEIVELETPKKD